MISLNRSVLRGLFGVLGLALAIGLAACSDDLKSPPPFELGAAAADAVPQDGG